MVAGQGGSTFGSDHRRGTSPANSERFRSLSSNVLTKFEKKQLTGEDNMNKEAKSINHRQDHPHEVHPMFDQYSQLIVEASVSLPR